jgi:hypothetical protein
MNTVQPLKTYSLLEILEQTFKIYRQNFLNSIILVAVVTIPISIVSFILSASSLQKLATISDLSSSNLSGGDVNTVCLSSLITIALAVLQAVLTNGPITQMASESYFGRTVGLTEALQARQARFTTLGWGLVLLYFSAGAFFFATSIISALCAPVIALLGVVVYVVIATYAPLAPVLMLENVTASAGLRRAWVLGKARFWTIVGIGAVIILITTVIGYTVNLIAGLIFAQPLNAAPSLTVDAFNTGLSTVVNIFLAPLLPIALTLFYYDTRIRLEGLGDALQAVNKPDARPHDVESPLPLGRLTPADWRNMAIIMVATVLLVLVAGTLLAPIIDQMLPGLPAA